MISVTKKISQFFFSPSSAFLLFRFNVSKFVIDRIMLKLSSLSDSSWMFWSRAAKDPFDLVEFVHLCSNYLLVRSNFDQAQAILVMEDKSHFQDLHILERYLFFHFRYFHRQKFAIFLLQFLQFLYNHASACTDIEEDNTNQEDNFQYCLWTAI